jgi:hypothetical protein
LIPDFISEKFETALKTMIYQNFLLDKGVIGLKYFLTRYTNSNSI